MFNDFFQSFMLGFQSFKPSPVDRDSNMPSSYWCMGYITNVGQPIYAIVVSPDSQMFVYEGSSCVSLQPA